LFDKVGNMTVLYCPPGSPYGLCTDSSDYSESKYSPHRVCTESEVFTLPPLFLEDSWRNYQEFFTCQYPLKWSFLVPPNPGGILPFVVGLPGFLVVPQEFDNEDGPGITRNLPGF